MGRFAPSGRIDSGVTSFTSVSDLITALRRAEAAHGEHEKRTGVRDANWADWYAAYMAAGKLEPNCLLNPVASGAGFL